jgi:hypothetical protein
MPAAINTARHTGGVIVKSARTRNGHRHGHRERQLNESFGTETVPIPRARIADQAGKATEWRTKALPRYQRLIKKAEALIAAVYLSMLSAKQLSTPAVQARRSEGRLPARSAPQCQRSERPEADLLATRGEGPV